jgi:hypothetical protein
MQPIFKNKWMAEVWVADEIFNYFEPFLFSDYFKQNKMSVDEFSVLFKIIQNFSVTNLRKDFDISKLYTSKLFSNQLLTYYHTLTKKEK